MRLMRNLFLIIFLVFTLFSVALISYGMYLYFGAYTLVNKFDVLIVCEPRIENTSQPNYVSVTTSFLFVNPSAFAVRIVYVEEKLYLNEQKLGEPTAWYDSPIQLKPNGTVPMDLKVGNIPIGKVSTQSSRSWKVELFILLSDMPLTDKGYFQRSLDWPT